MATIATISQPRPAIASMPCVFTVQLLNNGGSDVTVSAGMPVATMLNGIPASACNISPIVFPSNSITTVTASNGTLLIPFSVSFFGSDGVFGIPDASDQFYVSAQFQMSDGSVAITPSLLVGLAEPQTPLQAGTFDFSKAPNSMYAPFFL